MLFNLLQAPEPDDQKKKGCKYYPEGAYLKGREPYQALFYENK